MDQKLVFLNSEGDNWFKRNREKLEDTEADLFYLNPVIKYLKDGMRILEIGCSTGLNLKYLQRKSGKSLKLSGIDPSSLAIQRGQELFPDLRLEVNTAEGLTIEDESFDLIILGFCLYVINRESLPEIAKKVVRALRPGGHVVILDFDVKVPRKTKNKHFEGLMSYKMDYGHYFGTNSDLVLVEKSPWSHFGPGFHEDINERCATTILYKERTGLGIK